MGVYVGWVRQACVWVGVDMFSQRSNVIFVLLRVWQITMLSAYFVVVFVLLCFRCLKINQPLVVTGNALQGVMTVLFLT